MEESTSFSTTDTTYDQIKLQEAADFLSEKKYVEAADILSNILQKRANIYGETAYECADIALDYGITLLRIGQNKNTEQLLAKVTEKASQPSNTSEDEHESENENEEEETAEEVLESAWNSLEVARIAYERRLENVHSERERAHINKLLCEVYINLGELGSESNNFSQAVQDFNKALEYVSKRDYKFHAEIHVQLSTAYLYENDSVNAIKHYEQAVSICKEYKKYLTSESSDNDEILQDLQLRVSELKDEYMIKQKMKLEDSQEIKTVETPTDSKKVNILVPRRKNKQSSEGTSSLVENEQVEVDLKRKRDHEDETAKENGEESSPNCKKQRT